MTCPNCGHYVREGAKFCEECGIVLPATPATEAAQTGPVSQQTSGTPLAPPRRAGSYRTQSASTRGEEPLEQPSGTTMLPPPNVGQARRTFATVAVALIALLCCCCGGAAAILLYVMSQPTGQVPLPGLL
jgi:hypothetical protein